MSGDYSLFAYSFANHQFHPNRRQQRNIFLAERDNSFDRYRDIYAAIRAKPSRNHSRDLSLSPRVRRSVHGRVSAAGRQEKIMKSKSERVRVNAYAKRASKQEERVLFLLSPSLVQPARDSASVLVAREVASVSVDLHLVQRAEPLRELSVRVVRVSSGKSPRRVLRLLYDSRSLSSEQRILLRYS